MRSQASKMQYVHTHEFWAAFQFAFARPEHPMTGDIIKHQ